MKKEGLLYRVKNAASALFGGTKFTSAVILAGGSGTRVGVDKTKQMIELCGKPLVVHTLLAFEACDYVNEIVVVAKQDEIAKYEEFRTAYGLRKLTKIVAGGETRQMSAKNGFDAADERAAYVAFLRQPCPMPPFMTVRARWSRLSRSARSSLPPMRTARRLPPPVRPIP